MGDFKRDPRQKERESAISVDHGSNHKPCHTPWFICLELIHSATLYTVRVLAALFLSYYSCTRLHFGSSLFHIILAHGRNAEALDIYSAVLSPMVEPLLLSLSRGVFTTPSYFGTGFL